MCNGPEAGFMCLRNKEARLAGEGEEGTYNEGGG